NSITVKEHGIDIRIACTTDVGQEVVANHYSFVTFDIMTLQGKVKNLTRRFSASRALRGDDVIEVRQQFAGLEFQVLSFFKSVCDHTHPVFGSKVVQHADGMWNQIPFLGTLMQIIV